MTRATTSTPDSRLTQISTQGLGIQVDKSGSAGIADRINRVVDEALGESYVRSSHQGNSFSSTHTINTGRTYADGEQARVTVRQSVKGDGADFTRYQQEKAETECRVLLNLDLNTFGKPALKDLERAQADFDAVAHYDGATGQPVYKVQGRARENLAARITSLTKTVNIDAHTHALATAMQREHREREDADAASIMSEADQRANELIRQQRVEQVARRLAAQRGYKADR